ncbi:glycosyltransferase [Roseomonas sp. OT10]|uniref:glycosyltransferase family 4 protein n=1 Tax=Roseomonas cutis TaxID=2897332 RepID=UPI001E33B697|nr:glycosyltransferase family 4 protein [Roseomonas sp. OT10]UFN47220.1 glycosyltransferase [Roseomonas sp. OT10]
MSLPNTPEAFPSPADAGSTASRLASRLREAVLRRELAVLMQERNVLRAEVEAQRLAVARAEEKGAEQAAEAERLRRELAEARRLVSAIYASRSWRLAKPARGFSIVLRRVLGRGHRSDVPLLPAPDSASPGVDAAPIQATPDGGACPPRPSGRGTILVAADFLPLHDQSAGGLRLRTLMEIMARCDWSIIFGSLLDLDHQPGVLGQLQGRARYEESLRAAGVSRFLYGTDEIGRWLAEEGRGLDWAFLSFPAVAEALLPLVRSYCPTARVAYDMVDFHGVRMAREAALRDDVELMLRAERQRSIEISCARAADVTLAITIEEKAALLELVPDAVVEVLPIVVEVPEPAPPGPAKRDGILFVGGFWHQPNGDAVHWFVEEIWPLIRREAPDVVFRIVGANASDEVLALGTRPGVEVLGFVPDLGPLYDRSRVFVAPLRYGAGMKGKVAQSLVHGLPVVATPIGAEGMKLHDGVHLLVAEEKQGFAEAVLRLLSDDGLWSRLSDHGRDYIARTLSVDVVGQQLKALLDG